MESDFLGNIVKTLATAYVFVATIWAILLPSIREDHGRGGNVLWGILATIILALSAVYLVLFVGPNFGLDLSVNEPDDETPDISTVSIIVMFIWLFAFYVVGFGLLKALHELSYPRDTVRKVEHDREPPGG